MPEETTTQPDSSLSTLSLAEYRAHREKPVEAPKIAEAEEPEESTLGGNAAGETATDDTDDVDEKPEQPAGEQPRKKGGWQRKIEKAEREIEALKAQLAAKSAETAAPQSESTPAPDGPTFDKKKPRLEDFDSIETFTEALSDWKSDQRDFLKAQQAAHAKAQEEATKAVADWNSRQADARKAHADYDEALEEVSDVALSPAHQRIFLESEHGPEIAYQLARSREELTKFAEMSPLAAARYFGQLEASLAEKAASPAEPRTSKAPKPIRPISGGKSTAAGTFDVGKASLAEYRRARELGRVA